MNNVKAIKREVSSNGEINKLRDTGFIPAILYGGKDPNATISIEKKAIKNILNSESFLSTVIELDVEGKKQKVLAITLNKNEEEIDVGTVESYRDSQEITFRKA